MKNVSRCRVSGVVVAIVIAVSILVLSACGPSPVDEANAVAIQLQAQQDAADQEQARLHAQELHDLEMAKEKALAEQQYKALNSIIRWSGIFGSIALSISILALGISFSIGAIGAGRAAARAAMVRANLIPLDRVTRQFPVFVEQLGPHRSSLSNSNDGQTLLTDKGNVPDRQKISAAGLVQVAGVIASEAARSRDAGGVASVNPPVIAGDQKIYDKLPRRVGQPALTAEVSNDG